MDGVELTGIKDLSILLKSIEPKLMPGKYVYCKVEEEILSELLKIPLMVFKEDEAITLILEQAQADLHKLEYEEIWEIVTLTVQSSLTAVGFIAAVTQVLAEHFISTNVISGYYHDYLLVPLGRGKITVELLKELQKSDA